MSFTQQRLAQLPGDLAAAEQRVVRYLTEHLEEVVNGTVGDVARQAGASEATVVRVCKKAGYKGYRDFRLQVVRDLAGSFEPGSEVEPSDSGRVIARKVFAAAVHSLERTARLIDGPQMLRIAKKVANAREVALFGVGISAYVASDAMRRLVRIGIRAYAESMGIDQMVRASLLDSSCVVIGISISGRSRETVEAVRIAREKGATIVAVTRVPTSPLAQYADAIFPLASEETAFNTEAMASRLAALALLDALFVLVALQDEERTNASLNRILEVQAEHQSRT